MATHSSALAAIVEAQVEKLAVSFAIVRAQMVVWEGERLVQMHFPREAVAMAPAVQAEGVSWTVHRFILML
jgi:hypothetical protein